MTPGDRPFDGDDDDAPRPATATTLLLTVAEAADELRISRGKAYELIASKQLPSIRVGSMLRVPRAALVEWIDAHRENVT